VSVPQVADATASPAELSPSAAPAPGRPAMAAPAPEGRGRAGPRYALSLAVILQTLISAGDGLAMVALASRVYQTSHASWAVASVFLAVTVPITALAPAAGLLLDRLSPRPVLVAAAVAQTAVALVLTRLTGTGAILGLSLGFGVCAALLQPGLGAIVPQLAGRAGVTRANGYLQAATWGGFTVGPLLAGVLTAAGGTGLALGAVAAVYGLGAVGLRVLPLAAGPAGLAGSDAHGSQAGSLGRQVSAGLRFLRADREAGLLVLVVAVMVAFGNLASVAEVAFAEGVLKAGPSGYSVLVAAWTAGMLGGTLAGGRVRRRRLAVATLAGTVIAGTGVALAGGAVTLWQAAAAYGIGGLANGVEVVTTRSFLNYRVPAAISGRVFALYSGVLFGAASVGMAAAGGLLAPLNPRAVLVIAGTGAIAAGALGWARYARLRRAGSGSADVGWQGGTRTRRTQAAPPRSTQQPDSHREKAAVDQDPAAHRPRIHGPEKPGQPGGPAHGL
jgi:MFS family permease